MTNRYPLNLAPLAEVDAYIDAPFAIGPSSWGNRAIYPVTGGRVDGPRLQGRILPLGADWGLMRADGCFELDVRIVIETDDGALIHVDYRGLIAMTPEQVTRFAAGEILEELNLFVTPRFETSHPDYQWLTQLQAVARGGIGLDGDRVRVSYSWYALTP